MQGPTARMMPVCGPDGDFPPDGPVSVIGPGTGLGVAFAVKDKAGYAVCETEAGHVALAPLDDVEDRILAILRRSYPRVSVERLASGPGLTLIYRALADIAGMEAPAMTDADLWESALAGTDRRAVEALQRFCMIFGAVAGDIALAQGAKGVVLAGSLATRLTDQLRSAAFIDRFCHKGRLETVMRQTAVQILTLPHAGVHGAAAAYAALQR
jgi:glucokinase